VGAVRVLGLAGQLAVGDDAGDRLAQRLLAALEQRDDVVVALAHLAAVQAGQQLHRLVHLRLGQHEELLAGAEQVVEAGGHVARHLDVLDLVLAHRHAVGVEHQDVRGHQDGVAVQAHGHAGIGLLAGRRVGVHAGLVGVGPVHLALAGHAGQQPAQLGDLGDVALAVEDHALGVQAGGQPGGGDLQARAFDAGRVVALDQRVVVGHEEEALRAGLAAGGDGRAQGADVVAEVQGAGGGDAGQDTLLHGKGVNAVVGALSQVGVALGHAWAGAAGLHCRLLHSAPWPSTLPWSCAPPSANCCCWPSC
jgi:hypothetical protein